MRHKAYVPGVALLAALVVGCSAGTDDPAADSKPGSPTVSPAAPGKYRTLPDSCRAVPLSTLKDLLPGAAELPEKQQEKVYEGTAALTYDTDRRVGCSWKSESPDASRNLSVDFERVVSYDTSVSDDDRAREVYEKKVTGAGLPASSATASPTGDTDKESAPPAGPGTPTGSASASAPATAASGTPSPSGGGSTEENLRPRALNDLADAAFLNDVLTRAGSTAQPRTVSVVFRTSNVIVTVQYTEQPALITQVPDSKELQEKARALARKLAEILSE